MSLELDYMPRRVNYYGVPYKYHVYLGMQDSQLRTQIVNKLKNHPHEIKVHPPVSNRGDVEKAILYCEKTLLIVTDNESKDRHHVGLRQEEAKVANRKTETLSLSAVVAVNLSQEMSADDLKERLCGLPVDLTKREDAILETENFDEIVKNLCCQEVIPPLQTILGASYAQGYYYAHLIDLHRVLRKNWWDSKEAVRLLSGCDGVCKSLFVLIPRCEALDQVSDFPQDLSKLEKRLTRNRSFAVELERRTYDTYSEPYSECRTYDIYSYDLNNGKGKTCKVLIEVPGTLLTMHKMLKETGQADNDIHWNVIQFHSTLIELLKSLGGSCIKLITYDYQKQQLGNILEKAIEVSDEEDRAGSGSSLSSEGEENMEIGSIPSDLNPGYRRQISGGPHNRPYYELLDGKSRVALVINNLKGEEATHIDEGIGKLVHHLGVTDKRTAWNIGPAPGDADAERDMMDLAYVWENYNAPQLRDCQLFVCVLVTYGQAGAVLEADGKNLSLSIFIDKISRAEALRGKPKVFFIEASKEWTEEPTTSALPQEEDERNPPEAALQPQDDEGPVRHQHDQVNPDPVIRSNDVLIVHSSQAGCTDSIDGGIKFFTDINDNIDNVRDRTYNLEDVCRKLIPDTADGEFQGLRATDQPRDKPYMTATLRKCVVLNKQNNPLRSN